MATPAPLSLRRSDAFLVALVVGVAAGCAYLNTFSVPFIFDDTSSIPENATIRSLTTAWMPPSGGGLTVSGRPFLNFSLALNYAAHGTAVGGYHLANLLIHILGGWTLFGIVRRTLTAPATVTAAPGAAGGVRRDSPWISLRKDATWIAAAVALVWTQHPLQTQAVTYIVQRAESLVSLMYLLTLWAFIRSTESGASRGWAAFAWVACLLGMMTKEVMVSAPIVVILYDRVFVTGSWRVTWKRRWRFHLGLALTWLMLAWLVLGTAGRGGTAGVGSGVSPWAYALTQCEAIIHYLRLAIWPHPLVFDYGKFLVAGWTAVWWQALLLLLLASASAAAAWRGRAMGWLGIFFFAVLAPSSSIVPVATQTMSEHRFYLALSAVVALAVVGLYRWVGRKSLVVWALVSVVLGGATFRRNQDYRSELAIWEDTVVKRPTNVRALAALGAIHQSAGRHAEARVLLQEAVRLAPDSVEAQNNLGNAWMKVGDWRAAEACFRRALALAADDPYALNNLGNALLQLGRAAEAVSQFEAALRVKPDFAEPRFNLANTLAQSGRPVEALTQYDAYLRLKPDDVEARSNYAATLQMTRRFADAVTQLEFAVRLRPADARLQNNLGVAFAQSGRPVEARSHFEAALRLNPDFTQARENLQRAMQR